MTTPLRQLRTPSARNGLAWTAALILAGLSYAAAVGQSSSPATKTDALAKADAVRAQQAYMEGARLLGRTELAAAQAEFARAAALNPARSDYELAVTLTREHRVGELIGRAARARMTNHAAEADALLSQARTVDPADERVLQHMADAGKLEPLVARTQVALTQAPGKDLEFAPPIQLTPRSVSTEHHLRGDARQVVSQAALAYGIKTVFDDSVTTVPLRFDLETSPYDVAMPILLRMAHLLAVPLDPTTLLIAKDTEESRLRLERQVEETIYIPASTVEQLNELSNIVKNVFDVKQVVVSPGSGTILLRAPEPTLKAVNYTLADLLDGGAEVMIEAKLISVDKSVTRNIGATPPTQASAFSATAELQSFVSANQATLSTAISSGALVLSGNSTTQLVEEAAFLVGSGLATDAKLTNIIRFFGNGLTLFGVSVGSGATFNLAMNSSEARALDDLQVRVSDHQTANLRVGARYPITTSQFSSTVPSGLASALSGVKINGVSVGSLIGGANTTITPQIQYEDLGITLKATPTVLRSGLVSMHIDLKIEALTGTSANNIPVLTSRAFTSDITVEDGASAVMLSEVSRSEMASIDGYPGLGELPGLQETISDKTSNHASSELVLVITPHLVRRRSASMSSRRIAFRSSVPADF